MSFPNAHGLPQWCKNETLVTLSKSHVRILHVLVFVNKGTKTMDNNVGGSSFNNVENGGIIKEQDRLLPIANVGRIIKQILPQNAKFSKESKETMQECVSEFISFVKSEASEKCRKERRKTVNGDDICWALGTLGL